MLRTALLLFVAALLYACSPSASSQEAVDSLTVADVPVIEKVTVCFWDELGVKDAPGEKGKYLTTVYLGEQLKLTGDSSQDVSAKNSHMYYKVVMSDGKSGWVRGDLIAKEVYLGGMLQESAIYKRPDLATVTEKSMPVFGVVAIESIATDGWLKVKGKLEFDKWYTEGYVRADDVTTDENEVEFALLYRKANMSNDNAITVAVLQSMHANEQLRETYLYKMAFPPDDYASTPEQREAESEDEESFDAPPTDEEQRALIELLNSVADIAEESGAEGNIINVYGSDAYWYVYNGQRYQLQEKTAEVIIRESSFFHCTQEQLEAFPVNERVLGYIPAVGSKVE